MPFVGKLGNRNSTGGARAKKGEMRKEEDQRGDLSFGNFKVEMETHVSLTPGKAPFPLQWWLRLCPHCNNEDTDATRSVA